MNGVVLGVVIGAAGILLVLCGVATASIISVNRQLRDMRQRRLSREGKF